MIHSTPISFAPCYFLSRTAEPQVWSIFHIAILTLLKFLHMVYSSTSRFGPCLLCAPVFLYFLNEPVCASSRSLVQFSNWNSREILLKRLRSETTGSTSSLLLAHTFAEPRPHKDTPPRLAHQSAYRTPQLSTALLWYEYVEPILFAFPRAAEACHGS
jgi:hypothetical protein